MTKYRSLVYTTVSELFTYNLVYPFPTFRQLINTTIKCCTKLEVTSIQHCMYGISTTHKVDIHIPWSVSSVLVGYMKVSYQSTNIHIILARHGKRGISREAT